MTDNDTYETMEIKYRDWTSSDPSAPLYAVAGGLYAVASAIELAARLLGTNDAATRMGALEQLAVTIRGGLDELAGVIERAADERDTEGGD